MGLDVSLWRALSAWGIQRARDEGLGARLRSYLERLGVTITLSYTNDPKNSSSTPAASLLGGDF